MNGKPDGEHHPPTGTAPEVAGSPEVSPAEASPIAELATAGTVEIVPLFAKPTDTEVPRAYADGIRNMYQDLRFRGNGVPSNQFLSLAR